MIVLTPPSYSPCLSTVQREGWVAELAELVFVSTPLKTLSK